MTYKYIFQIVLATISTVAARAQNYDFLNTKPAQNVDNQELYGILQEMLNGQKRPIGSDRYEFKIEPQNNLNIDTVPDENVFENMGYVVTEKPPMFEKLFNKNDNNNYLKTLFMDINKPEKSMLDVPDYTSIKMNKHPKLFKEEEVLRVDENNQATRPQIIRQPTKSEIYVQNDDSPANQKQKLALLGLYAKRGYTIPRLYNSKIDWDTIVKVLKETTDTEENSSESDEDDDDSGTTLNEKLLKVIQKVKDTVLQLPEVDLGNIDLKHWINKGASNDKYNNDIDLNSNNQLNVLKRYLKSGGSIPFIAPSKSIWDGFMDNIQKKEHKTTTEHMNIASNINGVKDHIDLLKLYEKLNKPVSNLQNNINWTTTSNNIQEMHQKVKPLKKAEVKTEKLVTNNGDIEINYESLGLNDLLAIIKDLRQPGMTRDKIVNYLLEKQKALKNQTEKPEQMKYMTNVDQYSQWDLKEGSSIKLGDDDPTNYGQNIYKSKSAHLPSRSSYYPAKYNY